MYFFSILSRVLLSFGLQAKMVFSSLGLSLVHYLWFWLEIAMNAVQLDEFELGSWIGFRKLGYAPLHSIIATILPIVDVYFW